MSILNTIKRGIGRTFGYDAVEDLSTRRKQIPGRRRPEDREMTERQRVLLSSNTRDLQRNFSIAAWAIRKHLDYVSSFSFQANTGDDALDEAVEELMQWWMRAINCDAAGRLSLQRMIRMAEMRRTIDGDVFLNQLPDGRLQGIEGDRVVQPRSGTGLPDEVKPEDMPHGVLLNENGRAMAYAVHKRTGTLGEGLEFERLLSASFCAWHGYVDRFDQVRGVSPLAPAVLALRDVYENFNYALAKAKVSQLFALALFREASDELGTVTEAATGAATDDADAQDKPRYDINFGGGPQLLDLDPGDRAEFLESKTPSGEFQSFTNTMIGVALKALDIPFSFYAENFTNWSGQRQAWIQYDQSAEHKREDNRTLLNRLTVWRIGLFVRDGDLVLPKGKKLSDIKWEWISRGIPWLDPLKEITADVAAIKAGQLGPETSCRTRGFDVYRMIDERARVEQYAKDKGVVLEYMLPPVATEPPEESTNGKPK